MDGRVGGHLRRELEARGVSRREFLGFCSAMAVMIGLPKSASAAIADALENKRKPTLVWLEFQDCAGNTESFLRSSKPTAAEVVLELLSIDYHETIMAAAGHQSEEALASVVRDQAGEYIAVVEGSIPTGANGAYCTIGGKSAMQIANEVCGNAAAVIAVGTCATFGGIRPHLRIRLERSASPTRCPASRPRSTCRRVRSTPKTSPRRWSTI